MVSEWASLLMQITSQIELTLANRLACHVYSTRANGLSPTLASLSPTLMGLSPTLCTLSPTLTALSPTRPDLHSLRRKIIKKVYEHEIFPLLNPLY